MTQAGDEGFDPRKVAAVVYDDGVAIDTLMATFARELAAQGRAICGIVQLPPDSPDPDAPMQVRDLASGEIFRICQDLGPGSEACRLDPGALARAAWRVRQAAERPSDLLFVSKFGKQEVAGQGLRAELAFAAAEGRTVITTVKRGYVPHWLDFTGGVGTLLHSQLWVLHDWLQTVRSSTPH